MVLPCSLVVVRYTVESRVELKTIRVNTKDQSEKVGSLTPRSMRLARMGKRVEKMVMVGGR